MRCGAAVAGDEVADQRQNPNSHNRRCTKEDRVGTMVGKRDGERMRVLALNDAAGRR
jgi:hypothetical protein